MFPLHEVQAFTGLHRAQREFDGGERGCGGLFYGFKRR